MAILYRIHGTGAIVNRRARTAARPLAISETSAHGAQRLHGRALDIAAASATAGAIAAHLLQRLAELVVERPSTRVEVAAAALSEPPELRQLLGDVQLAPTATSPRFSWPTAEPPTSVAGTAITALRDRHPPRSP